MLKSNLFAKDLLVTLGDTDAAGRIYFASPAHWFHNLWEEYLDSRGVPVGKMLDGPFHLPIVNCELSFKSPLSAGDKVRAVVASVEVGGRSLTVHYEVQDRQDGNQVFVLGTITHVCVDMKSGRSTAIPEQIKSIFS